MRSPLFALNAILRRAGPARKLDRGVWPGTSFSRMSILVRVNAVAGVLVVAGCSSWTPSWDWVPSMSMRAANVSLTIESDPPGADAKTSLGASCRTPCMIPVAADREFTVSYVLNGYLPQVIPVRPRVPDYMQPEIEAGSPVAGVDLTPNPVFAQLGRAPPPPVSKKGRGRVQKQVKKTQ